MRSTDIFNLDFTTSGAFETMELANLVRDASFGAQEAIKKLEQAIAKDCREEAAWRLLASLYLGTDNMRAFNELEARHEKIFGVPMFAVLRPPRATRDAQRKLFDIPAKIVTGVLPDADQVVTACQEPGGAALDFTRVRGADAGGLNDLAHLLAHLPNDHRRPQLPGMDRFVVGLEKAAQSPTGTKVMWQVLFAYDRLIQDQAMFEAHALQFAVKFGISPPAY